jgi:hypothetical protein
VYTPPAPRFDAVSRIPLATLLVNSVSTTINVESVANIAPALHGEEPSFSTNVERSIATPAPPDTTTAPDDGNDVDTATLLMKELDETVKIVPNPVTKIAAEWASFRVNVDASTYATDPSLSDRALLDSESVIVALWSVLALLWPKKTLVTSTLDDTANKTLLPALYRKRVWLTDTSELSARIAEARTPRASASGSACTGLPVQSIDGNRSGIPSSLPFWLPLKTECETVSAEPSAT